MWLVRVQEDYAVPRLAIYRWPCTSTSGLDYHRRQQQLRGGRRILLLLRLFGILKDRCGGKASCSRTKCEPFCSCGFSSCSCFMWPAADSATSRPARPAKVPVAMRPRCLARDSVSARPMPWIVPIVDWLKCRWICQRTPIKCKSFSIANFLFRISFIATVSPIDSVPQPRFGSWSGLNCVVWLASVSLCCFPLYFLFSMSGIFQLVPLQMVDVLWVNILPFHFKTCPQIWVCPGHEIPLSFHVDFCFSFLFTDSKRKRWSFHA